MNIHPALTDAGRIATSGAAPLNWKLKPQRKEGNPQKTLADSSSSNPEALRQASKNVEDCALLRYWTLPVLPKH